MGGSNVQSLQNEKIENEIMEVELHFVSNYQKEVKEVELHLVMYVFPVPTSQSLNNGIISNACSVPIS